MPGPVRRSARPGTPARAAASRRTSRRGGHDPVALFLVHPAGQRHRRRLGAAGVGLDSCEALALFATGRLLLRADNRCVLVTAAAVLLLRRLARRDSAAPVDGLLTAIAMAVFADAPIALACIALALR